MPEMLHRFSKPLNRDLLEDLLVRGAKPPAEPTPTSVRLSPLREAVGDALKNFDAKNRTALDAALVEPVHRSLRDLSRREAADMRVWHWLCASEFPQLVWRRWRAAASIPSAEELPQALTTSTAGRFLGTSSLNGVSRNTLARLWWTAEALREGEDYELARTILRDQDMFQAIVERFFGMSPAVARACVRRLQGLPEDDQRRAAKWLQQRAATTAIEYLDESAVAAILDEALAVEAI
jgi:Family of unknown function (DUF6339)